MKILLNKNILSIFLFVLFFKLNASQISFSDSLKNVLLNEKHDSVRCRILNDIIANEYNNKIWPKYNKQLLFVAKRNINTKDKKERTYYLSYFALALNNFGYLYETSGNISKSFEFFNLAYLIQKENDDKPGMAGSLLNLGKIFRQQGNIPIALEKYHNALKIYIEINDKPGMAIAYNNIAYVYENQNEFIKAIEYYYKALKIYIEINDKSGSALCYSNLAYLYNTHCELFFVDSNKDCERQGHIKAIELIKKSVEIQKESNDYEGLASSLNSLGNIYENYGDPYCNKLDTECYKLSTQLAIDYYMRALQIRKEYNIKSGISISYESLAGIMFKQNKTEESYKYAVLSMQTAKELGFPENIMDAANILKKIYQKKGNYIKALESYELYIQMRDSITNEENKKSTYKKQFQIEYEIQATKDGLKHEQAINQQRMYTLSGFVGFIFMIIVASVSYKALKNKKKANLLLEKKNAEIFLQKEEILAQRDEIEVQRDIVTLQKEKIEEIHKEVTDSINYAKRIQDALLPISDFARADLGEHFILFKPKNIVSGDFYWTTKLQDNLYVCVADCTGHGVPGAFMSMLGISFLNEIVINNHIEKPDLILNNLRILIIEALKQKGLQGEQKDGMDISFAVINTLTNQCNWAGANNPLIVISPNNSEIIEIKPDKMPIAIYPEMKDFTNHSFTIENNSMIYLFSDGYSDQFGGPKGRKFMYKNFKELLIKQSKLQVGEQLKNFEETITKWIGNGSQTDDITVMGIRIRQKTF